MLGFPQPSLNPHRARPALFATCFAPWSEPNAGPRAPKEGLLCCVFAWDASRPRAVRTWPRHWGEAMELCNWQGGKIEAHTMSNFVLFNNNAQEWLRPGQAQRGPRELAWEMAEAAMDCLACRCGAPIGLWSSMAWVCSAESSPVGLPSEQALTAKHLLVAQWEADQQALAIARAISMHEVSHISESGPRRL